MKPYLVQLTSMLLVVFFASHSVSAIGKSETASDDPWLEILEEELVDVNPANVTGDIDIAGSSTVFPIAERLVEIFSQDGYTGSINVASIGSGAGFERWAKEAETDISNASRPIKDSERQEAIANGREPIEFLLGIDALAVVVNPDNDWATDISIEELAAIFSSEKWSDVNPSWPNQNILKFSPGTDSGTFDFFIEQVFDKNQEPLLAAANLQLSEDDNILSRGVQSNKYAIGYFGYAYYNEEKDSLRALDIEGITPNRATIDAASYPLARPLFMYSAASIFREKPQVAAFLGYALLNTQDVALGVGYFPVSDTDIQKSIDLYLTVLSEIGWF